MKMVAKKQIMIPKEVRDEIMRDVGVVSSTVTRALNFSVDNSTARLIRAMAMEKGGRVYDGTRDPGIKEVQVLKREGMK